MVEAQALLGPSQRPWQWQAERHQPLACGRVRHLEEGVMEFGKLLGGYNLQLLVKAASEVYAPIAGKIVEVNEDLEASPGLVNESAEDQGWFWRMEIADADELKELMSAPDYKAFLEGLD